MYIVDFFTIMLNVTYIPTIASNGIVLVLLHGNQADVLLNVCGIGELRVVISFTENNFS
jgi:hypothetical protein